MEREIKFRAKSLSDNKWVYGDLHLRCLHPHIHTDDGHRVFIDPKTIGQFTGLKDKNGIEIYDGDIINIDRMANKYNVISKVEYVSSSFKVKDMWPLSKYADRCEVIGNIYNTPELIK